MVGGFFKVVKLGSSLKDFLGSLLKKKKFEGFFGVVIKKAKYCQILSIYFVFRRNSKTAFCMVLASFLGGNKIILRSI